MTKKKTQILDFLCVEGVTGQEGRARSEVGGGVGAIIFIYDTLYQHTAINFHREIT